MSRTVFFGTQTKRSSQGIYQAQFDETSGQLSQLELLATENNPTYLAFLDKHLFAVAGKNGQGGLVNLDQNFQAVNHVLQSGAPLCYLSSDPKRHMVFGANYHKGEVLIYQLTDDGQLKLLNTVNRSGSGPHPNQDQSRVHFAGLTPDKHLIVCDLGTDSVATYSLSNDGSVKLIGNYQASPGAGSRHIVFHPSLKVAYLICELNSTVEVLIYDGNGQFAHYETHSTIPEDYDGFNACAAIRISSDGRFVYASNCGHDSIAVFRVYGDGQLERVQIISSFGKTPRDFCLTPKENHLIAVQQDSDNATVFKRDTTSGLLTETNHDFYVPETVCITFPS